MDENLATVPLWISELLRKYPSVQESSQRLAHRGVRDADQVKRLALDSSAKNDTRLDSITLFAASKEGDLDTLRLLLESRDDFLLIETLKRIREFGTEWAMPELISRVKMASDPSARAVFAWALAGYPDSGDAQDALLELIKREPDVTVRNHAIESLGEFRSAQVVNALLSVLEHGSVNERFWSLYSLGTIGDTRAVEAIKRCLQDETKIPDFGTISTEAKRALEEISRRAQDEA